MKQRETLSSLVSQWPRQRPCLPGVHLVGPKPTKQLDNSMKYASPLNGQLIISLNVTSANSCYTGKLAISQSIIRSGDDRKNSTRRGQLLKSIRNIQVNNMLVKMWNFACLFFFLTETEMAIKIIGRTILIRSMVKSLQGTMEIHVIPKFLDHKSLSEELITRENACIEGVRVLNNDKTYIAQYMRWERFMVRPFCIRGKRRTDDTGNALKF